MNKSEIKEVLKKIAELVDSVVDTDSYDDKSYAGKSEGNALAKKAKSEFTDALRPNSDKVAFALLKKVEFVYGESRLCETDKRGRPKPDDRSPLEIVVDATDGFIPLWAKDVMLRWRFNEASMGYFLNPEAAKEALKEILGLGIGAWGDATPVQFKNVEPGNAWDFELVMMRSDNCNPSGCVLASAFFPDGGQHQLKIYPKMFEQPFDEWIETLAHEIGHVYGLRHFFAQVSESAWPSEIFGTHSKFSIMNYGSLSKLTETDKSDLKKLYQLAWNGELTQINGTPIKLFKPYSVSGTPV